MAVYIPATNTERRRAASLVKTSPTEADLLTLPALRAAYANGQWTVEGVLAETLRRMAAADSNHPNVWITRCSAADIERQVRSVDDRRRCGEALPLFGVPVAVKDNIDVAGLPTTAACSAFAYIPERSAAAVQRLTDAGAIVVGKTNLDQFATGLVGARSPYGACRSALNPAYISGGSSSGSAVAVAAGIVPIALGTDTAGSGRVPAAFNNIVGLKPTRGLVSTAGVVPACRSLDCVSVFALTVDDAETVLDVLAAFNPGDPYSRVVTSLPSPPGITAGVFRFGRPSDDFLRFFGNAAYEAAFRAALEQMRQLGGREVIIDFAPFAEAARLLYEGPWVAERVAGLRAFLETNAEALFPVTAQVLASASGKVDAVATFAAMHKLAALRRRAELEWNAMDVLLLPTAGTTYTLDQMTADPIVTNTTLGYYTNFVNLLDLCGLAIPAGFTDGGLPFGISLLAPAGSERIVSSLGRRFELSLNLAVGATGQRPARGSQAVALAESPSAGTANGTVRLAVVGAHLSGLPLNHQLTGPGGRLVWTGRTTPLYRLFALPGTKPPKPGMARTIDRQACGIELEVWELPVRAFGEFVAAIPPPLGVGSVELEDGSWVKGFLCEAHAIEHAIEITRFGGWRAFLSRPT